MCRFIFSRSLLTMVGFLYACASRETPVQLPVKPQVQAPVQSRTPLVPYWVAAVGGLRIRSQPSVDGEVVGLLEQGAEIELEESATADETTINGRKGFWRKYKDGWIFDGYLEPATRVYYAKHTAGIPAYSSPAVGTPVRTLNAGTPVVVSRYTLANASNSPGSEQASPDWIGGLFPKGGICDQTQTSILWVNKRDLRPAAPRYPFCSDTVKRNCLDPALKKFVMAGVVNDRQDCVYQTALTLYPEGEVISCPGKIGSWTLQADGSIAIALHTRFYRTTSYPGDPGLMMNRPALIYIRKVNANDLLFPADMQTYWPQWRENIRKGFFAGEDSGFLPVTPDGKPFASYAPEC
ncbi:MAG: SH3 domain-containing protein [Leptospirales bacterium]|nr:SH3 domain-containing protein [Leptospirales bacterium]